MAKVTIGGEKFDFDLSRKPMSEALALEKALGCPYGEWETDMRAGSARATCGFIWLVWRRDGRDVKLADMLSGAIDFDMADFDIEPDEGETDEGEAGPTKPTPEASPPTKGATSRRSAK